MPESGDPSGWPRSGVGPFGPARDDERRWVGGLERGTLFECERSHEMKVLVTAASKHGATAEIASVIGAVLEAQHLQVDVLAPAFVEDVGRYDAVVLGSGVYAGHWLKPAKEFVDRHEAALRERPVFLFASGPVGAAPKEADEPPEMRAAASLIGANDHRVFGGRITGSQLGPFEKVIVRIVKAPLADDRPWDDIADWAKEIARYLTADESVRPVVGVPQAVAAKP
jgi:menaquinone-dependent protoporphyrinogen oxidase